MRNPQKAAELGKKYAVTGDFEDIVNDPDIDIVVELIGREHPAKEYIASALEHGKNVVTANKDVLAKYGRELFPLAELHNVDFMFEGAVGGGIPIIRPLKSCLAANRIKSVMGIVNGTTNYMLTKMSQDHMDYGEVLREAQEKTAMPNLTRLPMWAGWTPHASGNFGSMPLIHVSALMMCW